MVCCLRDVSGGELMAQKMKGDSMFCRQSTLWQLIQEKQIKFPEESPSVVVNGDSTDHKGK